MLFALPDALVVLIARIATYKVSDAHQRAMRQQMILGLIVVAIFCVLMIALTPTGPSAVQ